MTRLMGERLYGLDALRGVAAVMVVVMHLGLPIEGAHLAVDFFFMLSGLVMARTYEQRLASGTIGRWQFVRARYRRLWGWMALGTTIGFGVILAGAWAGTGEQVTPDHLAGYGLMLLLLPALTLAATPYLFNPPLWSIVHELLANLVHAFILSRLGRAALAVLAFGCALGLVHATLTAGFPLGGEIAYQWLSLWRVALAYLLGILLYRLFGDRPPVVVPLSLAVALLPAYALVVWLWPLELAPLVFILVLAPLMIFGGMGARFVPGPARDLAALLGALSFPLYALHFPIMAMLQMEYGLAAFIVMAALGWLWHQHRKIGPAPQLQAG